MKREAKLLLNKACDALVLSIELFNRPHERGRVSGTLIQLDHGFEMLMKAAILHRGGKIRDRRAKETIGFDAWGNAAAKAVWQIRSKLIWIRGMAMSKFTSPQPRIKNYWLEKDIELDHMRNTDGTEFVWKLNGRVQIFEPLIRETAYFGVDLRRSVPPWWAIALASG